jgi:hypothetical protein
VSKPTATKDSATQRIDSMVVAVLRPQVRIDAATVLFSGRLWATTKVEKNRNM